MAGSIGLVGCKPRTVTGQVFIVTQGAENVKLGGVQVFAIEKQQVSEFLQQRQAEIDADIRERKLELSDTLHGIETAEGNVVIAAQNLDAAVARIPASAEYVQIQTQEDGVTRTNDIIWNRIQALQPKIEAFDIGWFREYPILREYNPFASGISEEIAGMKADGFNLDRAGPLLVQMDRLLRVFRPEAEHELARKLKKLEQRAEDEERPKVDAAQTTLKNLKSKVLDIQDRLDKFPTTEDYLRGLIAVAMRAKSTQTDADGRFVIALPGRGALTLFAAAERTLPTETGTRKETYSWLVDVPTEGGSGEVFLNNNNITTIDPNRYFKMKPHQEP